MTIMTSPAEVTVLTPCYNGGGFIEETIQSVLSQSYESFEYLIINDGSTDNSLEVMEKYAKQDRRIVVISKENTGLVDTLNLGLSVAKGRWIARLDADDIAMPDRLERQVGFVSQNPGVCLLGSGYLSISVDGQPLHVHVYPRESDALKRVLESHRGCFPHSSVLFDKATVLRLGGYRHRTFNAEDKDLWLRMGSAGEIGCLPEPLIKYREVPTSISNSGVLKQRLMGVVVIICHFRRKWGLSDPSDFDDHGWSAFVEWVRVMLEREGFLELAEWAVRIKNAFSSGRVRGIALSTLLAGKPRLLRLLLKRRYFAYNIPESLARLSMARWPV